MRILIFASLCAVACAESTTHAKPQAGPPSNAPALTPETVLGSVNGVPIRRDSLSEELDAELRNIRNESMQRELHVLWVAVEDAVVTALIADEAKRQGLTPRELRRKEIEAKMALPSDDEIRSIYDANQEVIGVPYEEAAPHIKRQLAEEQFEGIERALVDGLRAKADLRYALPVPNLPRYEVDLGAAPITGNADAKVTIIEFSDFECPYCARASQLIKKIQELYPTQVRLAFRDFPLSQHKNAQGAAIAAQCAHVQGQFWAYHDLLFANTRALGVDDLRRYAGDLNLDLAAFDACLVGESAKTAVQKHVDAGRKVGIDGTPSIYINGIKLVGLLPLPLIQGIIDKELAQ